LKEREKSDQAQADLFAVQSQPVEDDAYKASREIERLLGLLRFTPLDNGFYVARCAPDCFVLPALAEHFSLRFGDIPWAIIDEKRGLCLIRPVGEDARMGSLDSEIMAPIRLYLPSPGSATGDEWENLWRLYHRSVNIENRRNPELQRQFMPARYWKYLPEINSKV
jgi:probable DNA metabolism protein